MRGKEQLVTVPVQLLVVSRSGPDVRADSVRMTVRPPGYDLVLPVADQTVFERSSLQVVFGIIRALCGRIRRRRANRDRRIGRNLAGRATGGIAAPRRIAGLAARTV